MSLHATEAFVLRTYSFSEANKICVFFTRDRGKVRGVAYGARKLKSRFGSALEPFTEVALTYHQKEGRELASVSACEILRSHFNRAARDVETANAFSYLAELLTEFLPEHEPNAVLYRLVAATLDTIEQHDEVAGILRYFEAWLLRLVGFYPDTSRCAFCDQQLADDETAFLTHEGAPRCRACSQGRGLEVDWGMRKTLSEIFCLHPNAFLDLAVPSDRIKRIGEVNYQIIRHALERDLRSRSSLKQGV